jgi:hypothetical protein
MEFNFDKYVKDRKLNTEPSDKVIEMENKGKYPVRFLQGRNSWYYPFIAISAIVERVVKRNPDIIKNKFKTKSNKAKSTEIKKNVKKQKSLTNFYEGNFMDVLTDYLDPDFVKKIENLYKDYLDDTKELYKLELLNTDKNISIPAVTTIMNQLELPTDDAVDEIIPIPEMDPELVAKDKEEREKRKKEFREKRKLKEIEKAQKTERALVAKEKQSAKLKKLQKEKERDEALGKLQMERERKKMKERIEEVKKQEIVPKLLKE